MITLCPNCRQKVLLVYFEKTRDQMSHCAGCGTYVHATYTSEAEREVWDFHFEKPRPVFKKKSGCGWVLLPMLLVLSGIIYLLLNNK